MSRHDGVVARWGLIAALLALVAAAAQAQDGARGALLYETHCVACHNQQVHWRDKKLATDWPSLKAQVQRWQDAARLQWSEPDVEAVARYLNDTIYRYPEGSGSRVGWLNLR